MKKKNQKSPLFFLRRSLIIFESFLNWGEGEIGYPSWFSIFFRLVSEWTNSSSLLVGKLSA